MWGTLVEICVLVDQIRFIPTHVGNSLRGSPRSTAFSVHPHACGELAAIGCCFGASAGSSPRMWGTRGEGGGWVYPGGFIPTHVGNSSAALCPPSEIAVHPHACGELAHRPIHWAYGIGSSPRMWGTRTQRRPYPRRSRFIPTHVGNSLRPRLAHRAATVHPHACGELVVVDMDVPRVAGSSPRMWGTHPGRRPRGLGDRFIPTHVGNSPTRGRGGRGSTVHPHACGELVRERAERDPDAGSSPRMWGTRGIPLRCHKCGRFIPTHVGNSPTGEQPPGDHVVHPHACGELSIRGRTRTIRPGSSPRMWGTRFSLLPDRGPGGFIPTHVGNSISAARTGRAGTVHPHACGELRITATRFPAHDGSSPRMWGTPPRRYNRAVAPSVHPHACGELIDIPLIFPAAPGSSPRMWGTPLRGDIYCGLFRFIPTHVGNSCRSAPRGHMPPVHPHACGELHLLRFAVFDLLGSSPRMWGTRPMVVGRSAALRFIPTHVGNSRSSCPNDSPSSVHPHACGELWSTSNEADQFVRFIPTHVGNSVSALMMLLAVTVHPHACGELASARSAVAFQVGSSPRMWGTRCNGPAGTVAYRFIPTHVGNS